MFLKKEEMSVFLNERAFSKETETLKSIYYSYTPEHTDDYSLFDPLDQTMGRKFTQLMKEGKISSEKSFHP